MDFVWLFIGLIITLLAGWGKYKLAQGKGCLISLVGIPIGAVFGYFLYTSVFCYSQPGTVDHLCYGLSLYIIPPPGAIIGYIVFLMIPTEKRQEYSEHQGKKKEKPKRG